MPRAYLHLNSVSVKDHHEPDIQTVQGNPGVIPQTSTNSNATLRGAAASIGLDVNIGSFRVSRHPDDLVHGELMAD